MEPASTRRFTGAQGGALVASLRGKGPRDVLLLHGGGQTRHAWDGTARALAAAGWRALALDQRGHGDSDWSEAGAYEPGDFAADASLVARAMAAESGGAPVAVGASLGGIAALLALGRSGGAPVFSALVLVDVVPRMDPAGVGHVVGFMRAHAGEGFATVEEAADAIAAYLPHRPRPRSLAGLAKNLRRREDGRLRWHWDPRFIEGPADIHRNWPAIEAELTQTAARMPAPALLVRGGASELVSEAAARDFQALSPKIDHVDIAAARHMVAGDRNDAFAAAVLDFLTRL